MPKSPAQSSEVHRGTFEKVRVWTEDLLLPTYLPCAPDKNPMFLEKRVYQGSSGKVYPLPFTDRISEKAVPHAWKAVGIENEFLRALVLPELGGRIHALQDKTNGYDLIYRQEVIKPALVGLAGPWISGGIEFNWPQHHRPATFLPVDYEIEEHPDGSITIWCSDHDPLLRMKGMHGVCLYPGRAVLELKVRAYNRTPLVQTFLWWANVATRVHEAYQSFFPPDVFYVADHARRSMSEYPLAQRHYYGVDYGTRGREGIAGHERPRQFVPPHIENRGSAAEELAQGNRKLAGLTYAPNDLSFYANIPVPTSYMCMGSKEDFFGGYDWRAQAGIVHVASHHISPGKKQWTWGNHEFGYAWDRNLTDADQRGEYPPYIEIMAGVYTDNQPDFSFLRPGETKTWSQYWYPVQRIGPPQKATLDAAVSLELGSNRFRVGVCVTRNLGRAVLRLERTDASAAAEWDLRGLGPGRPFVMNSPQPRNRWKPGQTILRVLDSEGVEIICYRPTPPEKTKVPPPATEPAPAEEITSQDELFLTGVHLEQYRHATRCPTVYWREALRRDPGDARCNNSMGNWHLRRGEFQLAEQHFCRAISRLTQRNSNPYDGEPYYNLGVCLTFQAQNLTGAAKDSLLTRAYEAFYKATWDQSWCAAGFHAIAEVDCRNHRWETALQHLNLSFRFNADNLRARNLATLALLRLGRQADANDVLAETRRLDPLDWWSRHIGGEAVHSDLQTQLDLAHDYARAGFYAEAIHLLRAAVVPKDGRTRRSSPQIRNGTAQGLLPTQSWGAAPLVEYTLGWLHLQAGDHERASAHFRIGGELRADYCFPARLEEIGILESALAANPSDSKAAYYLGNLLYDRRRHKEAVKLWERAVKGHRARGATRRKNPSTQVSPIAWRNLGIGYFNIDRKPAKSRQAYNRAFSLNPSDARLLYERDQLWKRLGERPERRLRELLRHLPLVAQRDDLSLEMATLYSQLGHPEKSLALLNSRHFQPWEGGEGGPLGQFTRAHILLGQECLLKDKSYEASEHFKAALTAPTNLGEARHLLANQSDVRFFLGCALEDLKKSREARDHWMAAAHFKGDFQGMTVRSFSEMTFYSALAWERLGQKNRAKKLLKELLAYARKLESTVARIDYFATSLPTMLLFKDNLQDRQETTALFLQAQALLGLGRRKKARELLTKVIERDPNHGLATDCLNKGLLLRTTR